MINKSKNKDNTVLIFEADMTENPLDTQSRAASSTPDVRTFGWKKTLLYSLLPTVVLLCFLEVAASLLEIWIPSWKVDYGWGFDSASKVFVPGKTPGIRITDPNKVVSFSPDEFKMPKPYGVYRIFMLGGSSVNYLHNHLRRFMASLNQRFAGKPMIEIIDVGGCAYGSHRLVAVLTEILDYQPDLILFHEANNEFEEREQLQLAQIERLALQKIVYKSALCRFIRDRIASFQVSQLQREKNRDILANKPLTVYDGYRRYDKAGIEERMRAFENNLRIMANLCQEAHVRFIISTVPSNL